MRGLSIRHTCAMNGGTLTRACALASTLVAGALMAGCEVHIPGDDAGGSPAGGSPAVPAMTSSAPPTAAAPSPSAAPLASDVDAQVIEHATHRYLVVSLPLDEWEVRIDWNTADDGTMLADVVASDPEIAVATNAGIFTPELAPGGLLVSDGQELVPLNLNEGGGNFHLMPNGVFAIFEDGSAAVMNSVDYHPAGVEFATQSGPALVLDGQVHPELNKGSTNVAFRSGVGVSPDGTTVYLAMSWEPTNFYDFATLFRDQLGVDDALYLDGNISDLWVEQLGTPGALVGPYAGVITARPRG